LQIGNALAFVADANGEYLRVGRLDGEFRAAAPRITESVAGNFRDRGGDAGLFLTLEAKQLCNAAGALPHRDDIALALDRQRYDGPSHVAMGQVIF
jgi:hypothetical protein